MVNKIFAFVLFISCFSGKEIEGQAKEEATLLHKTDYGEVHRF